MFRFSSVSLTWQYALVGGLGSLPFTAASYWQTGSALSISSVLFFGVIAGFLAKRRTGTASGVGFRVGVVGAVPLVWMAIEFLDLATGLAGPVWFQALGVVMGVLFAIVFVLLGFGLAGFVGGVGGKIGSWLAGSGRRRQSSTISS